MNMKPDDRVSAVALVVESEEEDTDPTALSDAVATEGPVDFSADGGDTGVELPEEHSLDASESLDPEGADASEASLDGGAGVEPDEVDLDETDGPPTPGA
jgi:hypothetical protein